MNDISRTAYRPFQADADWEWPFTRRTFQQIEMRFRIEALQGTLGCTKWALPLMFLPYRKKTALWAGKRLKAMDRRYGNQRGRGLWRCLNVAMHLRRRDTEQGDIEDT